MLTPVHHRTAWMATKHNNCFNNLKSKRTTTNLCFFYYQAIVASPIEDPCMSPGTPNPCVQLPSCDAIVAAICSQILFVAIWQIVQASSLTAPRVHCNDCCMHHSADNWDCHGIANTLAKLCCRHFRWQIRWRRAL